MTKTQLNRWKRLSFGFARQLTATDGRKNKLIADIENFFDCRVEGDYKNILDWDGNGGTVCVCDEFSEFFSKYDHFNRSTDEEKGNKFYHQLSACIRAGFDMAVAPSAGVAGWFTKQNCVDIFGGKVPQWFSAGWDVDWKEIPNEAYLWL